MNYKQVEKALALHEEFNHNGTMSAFKFATVYVVRSYNTVIAIVDGKKVYVTKKKYSTTTTRQLNIVKRVFANLECLPVEATELRLAKYSGRTA